MPQDVGSWDGTPRYAPRTVMDWARAPHIEQLAGMQNFAWVVRGRLARSEQPPLEPATFAALAEAGIGTVLSLRQETEAPKAEWGAYDASLERRLCEEEGLEFRQ